MAGIHKGGAKEGIESLSGHENKVPPRIPVNFAMTVPIDEMSQMPDVENEEDNEDVSVANHGNRNLQG